MTISPPQYNPRMVERVILEEAIDLHPIRLTMTEWHLRIASDPDDGTEVETIKHAIRDLRRCGLLRYRNDDSLVEPTQAALHAFTVLTGP